MKRLALQTIGLAVVIGGTGWTQVTQRVSVTWNGAQADGPSGSPAISADGLYDAFVSWATNLVPGDTNGVSDVFLRDRWSGLTERVSVSSAGGQGNSNCDYDYPSISADGRYVAFTSRASNIVPGDTNGSADVFVRDRLTGITDRVNVASSGAQAVGQGPHGLPKISDDGRYVAFVSRATNLSPGDFNGVIDVFVRDRQLGTTERVSVDSAGVQANDEAWITGISARGRHVAFGSSATNLVPGDTNGSWDLFVRDRRTGTTERVSVSSSQQQANSHCGGGSISADARYVAFSSAASNLAPGDSNYGSDIFVRDRQAGTTTLITHWPGVECQGPRISADGDFVAFGVISFEDLIYLGNLQTGQIGQVAGGNDDSYVNAISADGRVVAFESGSDNLVPDDTNASSDVFVYERAGGRPMLCEPGDPGVIDCPCANPPIGTERGCNNSAGTGGASLSSSGGAFFSTDSLRFRVLGQQPNALSILIQATRSVPAGAVYGQGVRCFGGTLTRLYTRHSVGWFTLPDLHAGDPSIHVRSAALGAPIAGGSTRWYAVVYRDPNVLGGCPSSSTFNTTPTIEVLWLP